MAQVTWRIEYKTQHNNAEDDKLAEDIIKMVAKSGLASLMLLSNKHKPMVMVSSNSSYHSQEEISLVDDIPQEPTT